MLGICLPCISMLLCTFKQKPFFFILSCTYFSIPFFDALVFIFLFFIALLYYVFSLCGKHTFYALNMRGINFFLQFKKRGLITVSSYMKKNCILYFGNIYLSRNLLSMPVLCLCLYCQHPVSTQLL